MTYAATRLSDCAMIEYTHSTTQTASTGTVLLFDTKRTTGGDSVSINSSTGEITLASDRRYWIQCSCAIERSANSDYEIQFQNNNGTALTESDGNFRAYDRRDLTVTDYPMQNSSYVASLIVDNPSISYRVVATLMPASSTVLTATHLFIFELSN